MQRSLYFSFPFHFLGIALITICIREANTSSHFLSRPFPQLNGVKILMQTKDGFRLSIVRFYIIGNRTSIFFNWCIQCITTLHYWGCVTPSLLSGVLLGRYWRILKTDRNLYSFPCRQTQYWHWKIASCKVAFPIFLEHILFALISVMPIVDPGSSPCVLSLLA